MQLTGKIVDGVLIFPLQNEIENLAIEKLGTCDDIYFGNTPINDTLYLLFENKYNGWILHNYGSPV